MTANDLVAYPFDATALLQLKDNCTFFDACVRQIAKDVVCQGWDVAVDEDAIKNDQGVVDEAEKKRLAGLAPGIEAFLADPNGDLTETIADILEKCVIDWGSVGWLGLEASRGPVAAAKADGGEQPEAASGGPVNGLWHVPAQGIKVHKDKKRYCQIVGQKKVWFKAWGEGKDIGSVDGLPSKGAEGKANELIFYRNYYSLSAYYGAPNCLPATGAILATIGVRDYNLAFFENYGVPAALVEVKGDWEEDAVKLINDFIDSEIKGSSAAHKTVVANPPEGGSITWTPLVTEVKEGHFKLYQRSLRDEILVAYRMPPYRIGIAETGSLGGTTATESTSIYVQSIIEPLQEMVEALIDRTVLRSFGVEKGLGFRLGRIDVSNFAAEVAVVKDLFGMGLVTRAMACARLDLEAPPEDDPARDEYFLANIYVPVADATGATGAAGKADAEIAQLERDVSKAIAAQKINDAEGGKKNGVS